MKKLGCVVILAGLVFFYFSEPGQAFFKIALDWSPPKVELQAKQSLFGRDGSIPFTWTDDHPVRLRFYIDDDEKNAQELENPQSPLQFSAKGLKDGKHVLHLIFTDQSWATNTTRLDFPFELESTPPKGKLLSPNRIWESRQGDTLLVFAFIDKPMVSARLELQLNAQEKITVRGSFFEVAPQVYCLLRPIDIETEPGEYTDRFIFSDKAGNELALTQRTKILKKPLKDGDVNLTPSILEKINSSSLEEQEELRARNNTRVSEVTSGISEEKYFKGPFIRPAQGEWTSPYGQNRIYNKKVWHRHLGMDIADVANAPVFAANDGVVVLAENLGIYGECVILDHGRGIYTLYGHNARLEVSVGDRVEKGHTIAIQGDTGLAGGVHLHLSFIVGGVYVAPDIFIQKFEILEQEIENAIKVKTEEAAPGSGF